MIRRIFKWVILPALALSIVVLAWLVGTESGLRRSASYLTGRMPQLTLGSVEGRLGGVAVFHDVRWASDGVVITIRRLVVAPRLGSVFGSEYQVQQIEAEGLRVATSPSDAPDEGELLDLPPFAASAVRVTDAQWTDGSTTVAVDRLTGSAAIGGSQLRVVGLQAAAGADKASGDLVLDLATLLPSSALLRFDWHVDGAHWAGQLVAKTQRDATALSLDLKAPIVATAAGSTRTSDPWTTWAGRFDMAPQQVDVLAGALGDAPVAASLEGAGTTEQVTLSGQLEAMGRAWRLERATLERTGDGFRFGRTRLSEVGGPGTVDLGGSIPEDPATPLAVAATFSEFALPLPAKGEPTRVSGTLSATGTSGLMNLIPDLVLAAPGLPRAGLTGTAVLSPTQVIASPLELKVGDGALTVVGPIPRDAETEGAVAIVARAFDPAVLLSEWPGRLDGAIAFRGRGLLTGAPDGTVQVQTLRGTLRGYPVDADGTLTLVDGGLSAVDFDARSGSASLHAKGRTDAAEGIAFALDAPDLSVLLPEATGAIEASGHIPGPIPMGDAPRDSRAFPLPLVLDAKASGIAFDGYGAQTATLSVETGEDGARNAVLEATAPRAGGIAFDRATLRAQGTPDAHTLGLAGTRGEMSLALEAQGAWADDAWTGSLLAAHIEQPGVADARLRAPAAIAWGPDGLRIDQLCLDGIQGNSCVQARSGPEGGEAIAELRNLPLALAEAFVALPEDVTLQGQVNGDARLRWAPGAPGEGHLAITSARGVWSDPALPEVDLGYENLSLTADWSGGAGQATLEAGLLPAGTIRATTVPDTGEGASGWRTEVAIAMPRLDWLEEFVPLFDRVTGTLDANLVLRRWPDAPDIEGLARVGGFATDLPTLGIRVSDGDFVLVRRESGLDVAGTVRSGDGRLALTGRLDREAKKPVDLRLRGNDFLMVDRGDARVVAAPDLTLVLDEKRIVRLGGAVDIPSARIDLSRLEAGAERSSDVVITDAPVTETGRRMDWRARVKTTVGPDVRLVGFGLDGQIAGTVTVNQRRGRVATGTGELMVDGRYSALGQVFEIERGRLLFAGGPLDNPSLLLTAEQRMGDDSTRVRITGNARRPELHVSSSQASTESEAISNLMGRSGAFSFGRYLSPKLYVGYGIGLVSGGEIFTVRYRINRSVELEANSGAENNASVNYRIER